MNRSENKQMALDLVEAGTEDSSKERVNKKLPPQVTSKMLYADVVRIGMAVLCGTDADAAGIHGGLNDGWTIRAMGADFGRPYNTAEVFDDDHVHGNERGRPTALVARHKGAGESDKAKYHPEAVPAAYFCAGSGGVCCWISVFEANGSIYGSERCRNAGRRHHLSANPDGRPADCGADQYDNGCIAWCRR